MENVEIHCSHVSRKPNEEKFTTRIRIRKKVDKDILFKAKVKIFNADLKSGISVSPRMGRLTDDFVDLVVTISPGIKGSVKLLTGTVPYDDFKRLDINPAHLADIWKFIPHPNEEIFNLSTESRINPYISLEKPEPKKEVSDNNIKDMKERKAVVDDSSKPVTKDVNSPEMLEAAMDLISEKDSEISRLKKEISSNSKDEKVEENCFRNKLSIGFLLGIGFALLIALLLMDRPFVKLKNLI